MINQEEYEILKECDDRYKWIVRDRNIALCVYTKKPYKGMYKWDSVGNINLLPRRSRDLFQFIHWKDEEPHSIAELIEEYEKNQAYEVFNRQFESLHEMTNRQFETLYEITNRQFESLYEESEETEVKKDLKEAILGIEVTQFDGQKADLEELVNPKQLEKIISGWMPEVLSQEWIDEHIYFADVRGGTQAFINVSDLQNLLVPEQELPVIPRFVAEWIEEIKKNGCSISALMNYDNIKQESHELTLWCYESGSDDNLHKLARAWLDGFTVEKEQKYYVLDTEDRPMLIKFFQGVMRAPSDIDPIDEIEKNHRDNVQFTEQEIKDYDERYLAFKEPVEEVGE